MNRYIMILAIAVASSLMVFAGCTTTQNTQKDSMESSGDEDTAMKAKDTPPPSIEWKEYELTDVRTGNSFKVADFAGKPVLLESFAVWCPSCKKQQNEVKALHEEVGDSVISIGLDADANEDAQQVLEYINENGYDWNYAISPSDFTQSLIAEFGVKIVNPPSAPVILVCPDGEAKLLENGVKDSDSLKASVAGC